MITIEEAREWIATHVPTAAHSVSTGLETAGQTLRLYLTAAIASAGPHWREIAAAIVVVLVAGGIMSVLHAQRRRELLEQSLVEAKLGHDPKTDWLELQIVMRNRQTRALLVHSIQVMDPPGTKICERWQAWRADGNGGGVKFVAPDLELSDSVAIERTIRPSEADDFAEATDELVRHFYVRMPKSWFRRRTSVEARLICELRSATACGRSWYSNAPRRRRWRRSRPNNDVVCWQRSPVTIILAINVAMITPRLSQ